MPGQDPNVAVEFDGYVYRGKYLITMTLGKVLGELRSVVIEDAGLEQCGNGPGE